MISNNYLLLVVLGMSLVTIVPRIIPVFITNKLSMPSWMEKWLKMIPYAALGALIFPGVLSVEPTSPSVGITGAVVAILLALAKLQIIYVIFGSIGAIMVVRILF